MFIILDSMSVQKLKGLLFRLLKVPGSELKLTYESSKVSNILVISFFYYAIFEHQQTLKTIKKSRKP